MVKREERGVRMYVCMRASVCEYIIYTFKGKRVKEGIRE